MSLALPDYNVGSKPGHQIATELLRRYLPKLLTENNVSTFLSAISTATAPAPRLSGFRYVAGYGGNGKKTAFSTMVLFKSQESGDEYALLICKSAMKEPDAAKATIAVILGMFMSFALCEQKALYDRRLMTDIIMPVLQDDRITQRMLYISTGSTVQLPTIVQLLGAFGMADYPYESLLIKPQENYYTPYLFVNLQPDYMRDNMRDYVLQTQESTHSSNSATTSFAQGCSDSSSDQSQGVSTEVILRAPSDMFLPSLDDLVMDMMIYG